VPLTDHGVTFGGGDAPVWFQPRRLARHWPRAHLGTRRLRRVPAPLPRFRQRTAARTCWSRRG